MRCCASRKASILFVMVVQLGCVRCCASRKASILLVGVEELVLVGGGMGVRRQHVRA